MDDYEPPEPIILTHRGIRCQFLLLPALRFEKGTADEKYTPNGHYSAQWSSIMTLSSGATVKCVANMLDARLYSNNSEYVHPLRDVLPVERIQQTTAVLTFSLKETLLLLPETVMGIDMYTPDRPGTVHTGSEIIICRKFRISLVRQGPYNDAKCPCNVPYKPSDPLVRF